MTYLSSSPPVVRLVNPADPTIGDPYVYGAERIFTVSVDQIATLKFYLDGVLVQTFPNVTEASHPLQIPLFGVHTVRVVAQNARGSGENYWTWSVYQYTDCHVPSGPYLDFGVIGHYRRGLPDCGGGTEPWKSAECSQNVMMRYARTRKSLEHSNKLAGCYWMQRVGCPEHCYIEETFDLDFNLVLVKNSSQGLNHAICAEFLGGDMGMFSNWKFYQFDNLDIRPGNWQMPHGTKTEDTKVTIYEITGVMTCALPNYDPESPEAVFRINEYSTVT